MHAFARQCIEVNGQGGREGFALTRAHFGDLALMQSHGPHELHIEMAHFHDALGSLSDHRKGLSQQAVQGHARLKPRTEFFGLGRQLRVA